MARRRFRVGDRIRVRTAHHGIPAGARGTVNEVRQGTYLGVNWDLLPEQQDWRAQGPEMGQDYCPGEHVEPDSDDANSPGAIDSASVESWRATMDRVIHEIASDAPYKIFKQGDRYVVKNNTGAVKASFPTRDAALKYLRALYVNVPGAARKAAKTSYTGTAKPS